MLGRWDHRVAVVERWAESYALPRAVCVDHEAARILQAIGMGGGLARVSHSAPRYQWFNADWEELLSINWSRDSVSGGPEVNFVHQPSLEAEFRAGVRKLPGIALNLGWELVGLADRGDHVEVEVREVEGGRTRTLRTRFLVGVDGADSPVREALGIGREDRGFQADWLVVDMRLNPGVTLDIPDCGQYCNPARPTTMVPGGVEGGRVCRRWEFMRLPGEAREALQDEAHVWSLLNRWVRPDQAELVRHTIYTFRSLVAETWRRGRVLLAGDAAHTMPPFMGQGMCAGIRDTWNLSWKLDAVLRGQAGDALLDSYTAERKPHVSAGSTRRCFSAASSASPTRHKRPSGTGRSGAARPSRRRPFRTSRSGCWCRTARCAGGAGRALGRRGRPRLLRRAAGCRPEGRVAPGPASGLGGQRRPCGRHRGGAARRPPRGCGGKYGAFLDAHGAAGMITRPDFCVFGGVAEARGLTALVDELLAVLADNGVQIPAVASGRHVQPG